MNKKIWIVASIEALLFLVLLGTMSKCNSDKIEQLENNIEAYKTEMKVVKTKNGDLMASRQSLILSESEMRKELDISKNELKELKKTLGDNIAYITKLKSNISVDTIHMKGDTVYVRDNHTVKDFIFEDEWMNISAEVHDVSANSEMCIRNITMNVPLEYGMTDSHRVFVKTQNPYVQFTDMNSVVVNGSTVKEKPKRFHHGITIGVGVHYGILNKKIDVGPGVMYGFTYSF